MIKVSDYVSQFLGRNDITEIFTVSGGGIAHLLDSIGRDPKLRYYCNYHEQACAISAEAYARVTGKVGACLVTIGPGAINALSGIVGAWYDSLPVLVLSGQVRSDLIADYSKIRQKGPQEGNVMEMARPVTKYIVSVRDPSRIRYELGKAVHIARSGRPGPVWVEIPFDIQGANVDEEALEGFTAPTPVGKDQTPASQAKTILDAIRVAERPLIVGGNGVRIANSHDLFMQFAERLQIPIVVPFSAKDVIYEDHPLNIGVFATSGQRRANFAVQNADLLISLGAGLSVTKVGFNYAGFAPKAKKLIVDIEPGQIDHQVPKADIPIVADLRQLFPELLKQSDGSNYRPIPRWTEACMMWKRRYPIILPEYLEDRNFVNMYVWMDRLADALDQDDVLVTGNGFDVVSCYQAFKVKKGQRVILSGNWGSMGWDLPLAIGSCIARGRKRTVLVNGDGSIQWNIQELLTAKYYELPLKIFILSNNGYSSIRATQNSLFEGRLVGADPSSGVGTMDFEKLAALYGFSYSRIKNNEQIADGATAALAGPGACICEVKVSPNQSVTPKASAFRREDGTFESRPLEDMSPFLPREEVAWNMGLFDGDQVGPIRELEPTESK
ncbi:MAG: thiamine pyrophosphate-binding protein [Chthoniobacterales bacterium]|nr:thiamine pyrophosphate-binding protein [Chthoniobacterales bacterium]